MKKFLVSGGAGFLGSNLCESLLNQGCYVYCIDNLLTGSLDNLINFSGNPNFQFIEHDIVEQLNLEVDYVCNLACPASPINYQKNALHTLDVCFLGTRNLLNLAKKNNAIFFHTSTSEVYGDPLEHPQKESYRGNVNPIGLRACYDEGKRVAETLIFDYIRMFDIDARVIRIFNTYGPNMQANDGRVVSNFINQALNEDKLTIYGDGSQTRSFCFVDDLVDGFNSMIFSKHTPEVPVNMGNPFEFTILDLAQNIIKLIGDRELIFKELPPDDPEKRKPDISLANKLYGWQPKIQLAEGLTKTIEYFKKNKERLHV